VEEVGAATAAVVVSAIPTADSEVAMAVALDSMAAKPNEKARS